MRYLEHGQKRGREQHRDQLDQRIALAGDLAVFEVATSSEESNGQKYDHITLSFSENHVSDEVLQIAVMEFQEHALAAWPPVQRHRIAFYAEAHRPRIASYTNSETGELVERLTHIHIGLGKHDLLTGESVEPLGFLGPQSDNLKYIDAWQEAFNARHGLSSPKDSPKISPENAVDILARYTGHRPDALGTFNEKKSAFELVLQKEIMSKNVTTWGDFGKLLSEHGELSKMREGQFGECYRIKPHGASRAMRLQGVFFQRQFIERPTAEKIAIVSDRARTAYMQQMQPRKEPHYLAKTLSDWHQFKARENRYLHTGSKFYREVYRPADAATRQCLLDQIERKHHGIQGSATTQNRKATAARNRMPKMPVRNMDGIQSRTEMLLRDHSSVDVRAEPASQPNGFGVRQTDGAGRRRGRRCHPITQSEAGPDQSGSVSAGRDAGQTDDALKLPRVIQPSSVLARVQADMRERYEQATDKDRYAEIRQHLDCAQLLGSLSHTHGLNPELYQLTKGKDGTPRIQCGSRALTPSDFLTKELGLPWRDSASILRKTYEHQIGDKVMTAQGRAAPSPLWREMKAEQLACKATAMQRLQTFDDETKARRAILFSKLKIEQTKALAGLTGANRKVALSLEKLRAVTIKAEFSDTRRALRKSIQPTQATVWRSFLQARAQAGSEEALAALRKLDDTVRAAPAQSITGIIFLSDEEQERTRRRRARESLALILKTLTHSVQINGDITYIRNGRPVLRDEGRRLAMLDEHSEEVIAAGLLLASEKFGPHLALTGSSEFQRRVVEVAVAQGIDIKFVDPQLEAMRLQLTFDKRQTARTEKERTTVAQLENVKKPEKIANAEEPPAPLHSPIQAIGETVHLASLAKPNHSPPPAAPEQKIGVEKADTEHRAPDYLDDIHKQIKAAKAEAEPRSKLACSTTTEADPATPDHGVIIASNDQFVAVQIGVTVKLYQTLELIKDLKYDGIDNGHRRFSPRNELTRKIGADGMRTLITEKRQDMLAEATRKRVSDRGRG